MDERIQYRCMRNKKLLIFIWNLGIGGVQKRVRDILLDMEKNYPEWTVYLLVKRKDPHHFNKEIEKINNVKVIYFPTKHRIYNCWSSIIWIAKEFLIIKPDVCLTFLSHFSVFLIWLKKIFFWQKTKLILNEGVFTSGYLPIHSSYPKFENFLVRLSYKYADLIIAPTKAVKNNLTDEYKVPRKKIKVISNWTLFKAYKSKKSKYDLIYIGRFEKEKNLLKLIDLIVEIKKKIKDKRLEKNVIILKTKKDIIPYLRQSKVFVTLSCNEGLPNVILEAGMCQLFAIANNFEGVSEVIRQNLTGYYSESKKKLCNKIIFLLRNENIRKEMGIRVQKHILKFFGKSNQERFIKLIV